jgi:hypothetical protein
VGSEKVKMIISILQTEKQIQLDDLIRFDASQSVLVKGSVDQINSVEITPGADGTPVEVFVLNKPKEWYLDFVFSGYSFDVDTVIGEITFKSNGNQYSTFVAAGTYTLANLLTAIKNAMEAVASPLTVSLTVDEQNRIKITPSLPLELLPGFTPKDLFKHVGFNPLNEYKCEANGEILGLPVEYGIKKVTLEVASISESTIVSKYLEVYTAEGDALFSEDSDLVAEEPDIMKWLPAGKGSFINLHRKSQKLILDWLDKKGYRDDNGKKITKWAFIDNSDVRMWSYYQVLKLFFMSVQNAKDDVFKKKAEYYEKQEIAARDRAVLNLDLDGDKKEDSTQGPDIQSGRLFFR